MGEATTRGVNSPFKTPGKSGRERAELGLAMKVASLPPAPPEGSPSRQVTSRTTRKALKRVERRLRDQVAAAFLKSIRKHAFKVTADGVELA